MNKNKNKKEMKKLGTIQSFFLLEKVQIEKLEGFYKNFYQPFPHSFFHEWGSKKISLKIEFFRFLNKFIQYKSIPEKKRELLKKKQKKSSLPLSPDERVRSFFDLYTKTSFLEKKPSKNPMQRVQKKKKNRRFSFFSRKFFFCCDSSKKSNGILWRNSTNLRGTPSLWIFL